MLQSLSRRGFSTQLARVHIRHGTITLSALARIPTSDTWPAVLQLRRGVHDTASAIAPYGGIPLRNNSRTLNTLSLDATHSNPPLDLSLHRWPSLRPTTGGLVRLTYATWNRETFPPDTIGHLYYRPPPPNCSPLAGELRFQLARSSEDLLRPNGLPWTIPFIVLATTGHFSPTIDLLLQDGLIDKTTVSSAIEALRRAPTTRLAYATHQIVYALGQPFSRELDAQSSDIWLLTDCTLTRMRLYEDFSDRRDDSENDRAYTPRRFPYTGTIHCCFERTNPANGPSRVVLRTLKTDSISCDKEYDGWIPKPTAGQLLYTRTHGGTLKPWSIPEKEIQLPDSPVYGIPGLSSEEHLEHHAVYGP